MNATSTQTTQLFPIKNGQALATTAEAAVARAAQEVQAAMVIAKKFPRNETEAFTRIMTACKRKSLAECAVYSYPRGGVAVSGPSIRLAECLAQNWGNMDFGVVELDQRNGESQVMAYAWDLETNTRQTKIFTVKHERRVGKGENFEVKALLDPRDIYELVANSGARRLRACILGVIPGDVVDAAVDACEKTIQDKDSKMPLVDKVRTLPEFFGRFGVSITMLEKKLGHTLDTTTSKEYSELLKIYNALKDNVAKVDDFFSLEPTKPKFEDQGEGTDLGPAPRVNSPTSQPEQRAPESAPVEKAKADHLKALLPLMKSFKVSEALLLDYLRTTGKADESLSSLAEVNAVTPSAIDFLYDHWQAVVQECKKVAK